MSVSLFRKLFFNTLPILLFISLSSGCTNSGQGNGAALNDEPAAMVFGLYDECVWTEQDSKRFPKDDGCI